MAHAAPASAAGHECTTPSDGHALSTWIGGASTNWTDARNWQGGATPRAGDAVNIQPGATHPIATGSVPELQCLFIASGAKLEAAGLVDQIVQAGATVTNHGHLQLNQGAIFGGPASTFLNDGRVSTHIAASAESIATLASPLGRNTGSISAIGGTLKIVPGTSVLSTSGVLSGTGYEALGSGAIDFGAPISELASGVSVVFFGSGGFLKAPQQTAFSALVINAGARVDVGDRYSSGTFRVTSLTNYGTVRLGASSELYAATVTNGGTIEMDGGPRLAAGRMYVTDYAQLGSNAVTSFGSGGGIITTGTIDLRGGRVVLASAENIVHMKGRVINSGATIEPSASGITYDISISGSFEQTGGTTVVQVPLAGVTRIHATGSATITGGDIVVRNTLGATIDYAATFRFLLGSAVRVTVSPTGTHVGGSASSTAEFVLKQAANQAWFTLHETTPPSPPTIQSVTMARLQNTRSRTRKVTATFVPGSDDPGGVGAVSVATYFDHAPDTKLSEKSFRVGGNSITRDLPPGQWWFHAATLDEFNNVSSTVTKGPFYVDAVPLWSTVTFTAASAAVRSVLARGDTSVVRCNQACEISSTFSVPAETARRLGLVPRNSAAQDPVTIGMGSGYRFTAGRTNVVTRLVGRARRLIPARAKRPIVVTQTVTVESLGGTVVKTRKLRLRPGQR